MAITEIVRILKPGGKLVITHIDTHNYEFLRTEQFDIWLGFEREDIKAWFSSANLRDLEINCLIGNCCANSTTSGEIAEISIFLAIGTK